VIVSDKPRQQAGSDGLWPIGTAARAVGTLRTWIDRAIQRGHIPCQRINGVRMVTLADAAAVKKRRDALEASRREAAQ
jgi:hypothetical protein